MRLQPNKVFSKLFNSILPQHLKHPRDSKLVIGTIGILLSAKKRGFLTRIRPELEKLIESGILIHPALINEALKLSGEL
jgi:hypothetical protein